MAFFDIQHIRSHFPALHQQVEGRTPIFLDGPGGTQVTQSVLDAMSEYLGLYNSNLMNSPFFAVKKTHEVVAEARQKAAAFVNAPQPESMIFGASMSALTAHLSRSISREWQAGDEIIVTALDHYSNVSFWKMAAEDKGVTCHIAPIRTEDCTLDTEALEKLISPKTKLIAFTLASNVTGSRTDAERIIEAAKAVGALTYVDSVHAAPHFLPNVQALDCDFLACSAYKFGGPHLGFVYGRLGLLRKLTPYKVEPAPSTPPECWEMGTKSFEALAGLSACIDYMASFHENRPLREALIAFYHDVAQHEQQLAERFIHRAENVKGMKIYGITDKTRCHKRSATFGFRIEGKDPLDISNRLAEAGISTGSGHFYAKGVIDALELADKGGIVRAGFVHYNTGEELDALFEVLETL